MKTFHFSTVLSYQPDDRQGIAVPISLSAGGRTVDVVSYLDTGASACIFPREIGERLGLTIETGTERIFGPASGGAVKTYGHNVSIEIISEVTFSFQLMVWFTSQPNFQRALLGREGWLHMILLGIDHYQGALCFGHHDDQ
ncbi:MAG: retropepsin-like aspartic protease [Blastocatellia bacterium]